MFFFLYAMSVAACESRSAAQVDTVTIANGQEGQEVLCPVYVRNEATAKFGCFDSTNRYIRISSHRVYSAKEPFVFSTQRMGRYFAGSENEITGVGLGQDAYDCSEQAREGSRNEACGFAFLGSVNHSMGLCIWGTLQAKKVCMQATGGKGEFSVSHDCHATIYDAIFDHQTMCDDIYPSDYPKRLCRPQKDQ